MDNNISGIAQISLPVHSDERGFFKEILRINQVDQEFGEFNIKQINHSRSSQNTLRGIHIAPWNKVIYVPRGKVQCVIVDCRPDSPTLGKYSSFILGDDNRSAVFVPANCGNSYLVLSEDADYIYFTDEEWAAGKERDIIWNDPTLNIDWEIRDNLSLSDRDQKGLSFLEYFPNYK
jgi:dTDP-4-dehydrorhamnose 3,5-epimerase